eukprot:15481727-Alexandrium_andersonii.AAC.1
MPQHPAPKMVVDHSPPRNRAHNSADIQGRRCTESRPRNPRGGRNTRSKGGPCRYCSAPLGKRPGT